MTNELASFAFIITLAAVINGLGIVRWVTSLAEYLRRRESMQVEHDWVFTLFAAFQFMLHILMWWSLWSVRGAGEINFLKYVYLLVGPVLLYLGTSVLVPDIEDSKVATKAHYARVRPTYATVLALLWVWSIFMSPVNRDTFAPTAPAFALFLIIALVQRFAASEKLQPILALANWLLFAGFVGIYAMELGGISG